MWYKYPDGGEQSVVIFNMKSNKKSNNKQDNDTPDYVVAAPANEPRTLQGAGGARLFDLPGVVYPPEALGFRELWYGSPVHHSIPERCITTREAARILKCSPSAARQYLHVNNIRFYIVGLPKQSRRYYWDRRQVEELASEKEPVYRLQTELYFTTKQALKILGISRTTLHRHFSQGKLTGICARIKSAYGARRQICFLRRDVMKYAEMLQLRRKLLEELKHTEL